MRYGICTGIENAGLVKKLGYDYIELSVTKTMGLDPVAYAAGKKALEESGIEAECFNILFPKTMNFVDGKTTSLDELEIYLEKAMAMIADLNGKVVVFGSGKCRTCPPEVKYLDAYENLDKACRLTGEIAGRYGIRVVIEPLSRKETNMVCTVAEGALLQRNVANDNVGLLADYFHICANHDDLNSIAVIKDFGHIHIASGNGRRYPLPGDGENYGELFAALHTAGYHGRIWGGDLKRKTEGPQLMKHNGYYYLLAAEGGTGVGHRISAARSKNVWGPYENCPYNPILRQDDEGGYLQNCGHGKLLQTADGRWFLCFLCLRRDPDGTAPMGRETSIAEVTWTPDGWPVAAYGRRPRAVLNMPLPKVSLPAAPSGITCWKGGEWITQRALDTANFTVENEALTLCGNGLDLCDRKMQGLLLVRQQERAFTVETVLEIPAAGTAGLTCYYDEHSYLKFGVGPEGLVLEEYAGYEAVSRQTAPLPAGTSPVRLRVTATGGQRHFAIQDGTDWRTLWSIPEPHYLTSEGLQCGKRFTGAMVGLYVHGASAVRFTDWSAVWSCPEEKR